MVKLKPLTVYDWRIEWLRQQRNRPEMMKYFRQNTPLSYTDQRRWFGNIDFYKTKIFIVQTDEVNPKPVGYVALNPVDRRHLHAEFGIFVVPEEQNKGYASEAMKLLLEYGFKELKLHKIYSDVFDYPGEKRFSFYENLGFKMDGVNRQHYLKDGKWIDSISFSMLEKEYEKNKNLLGTKSRKAVGV